MSTFASGTAAAASRPDTLFLVFRIGQERFALQAREIAEVLPCLALKPIAGTPDWVAGIFAYRGAMVPVIDLCALTFGSPAAALNSTRLVIVHYAGAGAGVQPGRLLGLILEQASETLRCVPDEFCQYGLSNHQAPYLGPVREDAQGLLQWITVSALLTAPVRELLYSDETMGQ
jgi:chemotaxis-related protein WspB